MALVIFAIVDTLCGCYLHCFSLIISSCCLCPSALSVCRPVIVWRETSTMCSPLLYSTLVRRFSQRIPSISNLSTSNHLRQSVQLKARLRHRNLGLKRSSKVKRIGIRKRGRAQLLARKRSTNTRRQPNTCRK